MKVIRSYTELHHYLHNYDIFYKSEKYKLKIPQWNADENNRVSNIINNYSRNCGCNSKNYFICGAFVLYAALYFGRGGTLSTVGADEFIWLFIFTICSAVTGKLLGLTYGRRQMIKFINKLSAAEHLSL